MKTPSGTGKERVMKKKRLQPKWFFRLLAVVCILILVLTMIGTRIYRRQRERQFAQVACNMASIAAGLVDGDRIAQYQDTLQKDESYEAIQQRLQMILDAADLKSLYVAVPEDTVFYLWDTESGGEESCDLGETRPYSGNTEHAMHAAFSARPDMTMRISRDEQGYLASGYAVVLDSAGQPAALTCVDIALDAIDQGIHTLILLVLVFSALFLLGLCCLYFFYLRRNRSLESAAQSGDAVLPDGGERKDPGTAALEDSQKDVKEDSGEDLILEVEADTDKLPEVLDFINGLLEKYDCPPRVKMMIELSVEELFVNIALYAYPESAGWAKIHAAVQDGVAVITLKDGGIPYNPLERLDPDVTLSSEERKIGGLGIFLVKRKMDDVAYRYEDGCNVLTIKKALV